MEWWLAALGGALAVLAAMLAAPRASCPGCKARLPRFRKPDGMHQLLWGGWSCPACGLRVDRKGQPAKRA